MARTYQRGKVHYSDILFPGHPKAGKDGRLRIPLETDKGMALDKLRDLIKQRDAVKYGRAEIANASYEFCRDRFLKRYSTKSKITRRHYERAFRELEAARPITEVHQITPDLLIDVYIEWKNKKGRGLYVRNRDLECLLAFVRRCENWQAMPKQDWHDTLKIMDREPRGRVEWFTMDELQILLGKTYGRWHTMTMLGARAGLRPSEMYWLEWADVDLVDGKIHIDSKPRLGWNVKAYERRTIPMPPDLKDYLAQVFKTKVGNWVVGDEDGDRPNSTDVLSTYYSKRVRAAKLTGHLYKLRHTYGSHLAHAGRRLEEIRDLMGHKDTKTTEIYVHLLPHSLAEAANSLPPIKSNEAAPMAPKKAQPRRKTGG